MARLLKQSTALTFRIGPFVDSTDGVTAETALTIAQADIQISKNGGAFAQTSASPTTTHDTDGWYQCPLTTTDTNTLGPLTVKIRISGALPVWEHFMVVPANVYDSLVGNTDTLQVDVAQFGNANGTFSGGRPEVNTSHVAGTAQTARDLGAQLDATVSSRSTYAGADTAGTTTLLSRLTSGRATGLDNLDATISSRSTYAGGDTAGTTTLLSRLTATRAGNLDNLDAAVSSRSTYAGGAVASVTGNVGGNVVGSVGSVASGGITSASFGIGAIDGPALASTATEKNADALLNRNVAGGSNAGRLVKLALYRLVNRIRSAGGTLTIYATDDTTSAFTQTLTTAAGDPITEADTD